MSEGFGLVVRFSLRDQEAAKAFDALCAVTLEGIKGAEPGTLTYMVHVPEGEPLQRVFYELYADRQAFAAHEAQPHTRHFLAQREQYLAGVEVTFLDAITGKRAERTGSVD
ncbi:MULTISPECIES: putative quinol monooxygenase [Streptomyces]|uniref:putative quinol monooxygenase n=1 Tax=Streptomyces TaxID=1883 RepID=UPI001F496489|nr:antibiotic biosynthesis monooxygenase [Streptomyces sp. W1SF4]